MTGVRSLLLPAPPAAFVRCPVATSRSGGRAARILRLRSACGPWPPGYGSRPHSRSSLGGRGGPRGHGRASRPDSEPGAGAGVDFCVHRHPCSRSGALVLKGGVIGLVDQPSASPGYLRECPFPDASRTAEVSVWGRVGIPEPTDSQDTFFVAQRDPRLHAATPAAFARRSWQPSLPSVPVI